MLGQEEWVPCVFELETVPGQVESSTWTIRNVSTTPVNLSYVLPLATRKGNQRLFLSGITIGVQDAGPGNTVKEFHARGITHNQGSPLEPTKYQIPISAPTRAQHIFQPIDCSQFDVVKVVVYFECTAPSGVDVSFVTAKCHYV